MNSHPIHEGAPHGQRHRHSSRRPVVHRHHPRPVAGPHTHCREDSSRHQGSHTRGIRAAAGREIYERGVAAGESFDQIERLLAEALPKLRNPLVPCNVAWFTVRSQDFGNPALAQQLLDTHGEDRGEGRHLYRFPVVFPSDYWQTVMPHELAAWGASERRYWSEYSPDGRVRHCKCHAPVPLDTEIGRAHV